MDFLPNIILTKKSSMTTTTTTIKMGFDTIEINLVSQIFDNKYLKYGPKMFENFPCLLWMSFTIKQL